MEDGEIGPNLIVSREIMERAKMADKVVYPTRRKLKRGIESAKGKNVEALTWTCLKCGKVNRPQRRLFATLPVIKCTCGEESNVQFDFSLHKIEVNDHFLIPTIRQQNPKECGLCSMLALAETSWRVNAILNGQMLEDSEPFLDSADLLEKFNHLCDISGMEKRFNQTAVETMFEILSTIGVLSDISKKDDGAGTKTPKINEVGFEAEASNPKKATPKLYILPFYSAVKKDFSAICRLLGDGYVIRTSFYAGRGFSKLKPGKIYKSPRRGRIRHAIVLVGAGRRGKTNYYHLLNSWGKKFCLRILKRGVRVDKRRLCMARRFRNTEKALGGFGLLRESDIKARPVTFLRHADDYTYYESLLLKDIVPVGRTKEGPEASSITTTSELKKSEGTAIINSPGQAMASCCGGFFAGRSSAPSSPNDMTVRQVADKLASFVAKNGRQFENITRQRNPGDTPFKFLFDKHCPDYKDYEFQLAEEGKALAKSKEAEASTSAKSGIASFKAPGRTHRSSFEQKSNYQTPASALYGAYEGSSFQGSSSSYEGSLLKERNEQERESGSSWKVIKKYEGSSVNTGRTEALPVA